MGTGGSTTGETGGTTGSGGEGSGGVATGGSGTGGTGTGGGTTADCSSLPLCTDFDSDTVGTVPAGFTANLGYGAGNNPERVAVTSEEAHSAPNSVKVVGTDSLYGIEYANPGDTFYLRTWLKVIGPMNGNLVVVGAGTDPNNEVRMRVHRADENTPHSVVANVVPGDGLSPVNSAGGLPCTDCVALPDDWFCFEMYVDRASQTLKFWVGDEQAVNMENNAPLHSNSTWPSSLSILRLGAMSANGGSATVYIDDVAVGPSRIGCN